MKKLMLMLTFTIATQAGVMKVATFPVRHPMKTTHGFGIGVSATGKALGKSVAHVGKALYNF